MKIYIFLLLFFPLLLSAQNNKWGVFIASNYWLEKNNIVNVNGYAPYQINNHFNWQLGANYQWTLRNKRRHIIAELGLGKHNLLINSKSPIASLGYNSTGFINFNTTANRNFTYISARFVYDWHINKKLSISGFAGLGLLHFINRPVYTSRFSFLNLDSTSYLVYSRYIDIAGNKPISDYNIPFQPYTTFGLNVSYNLPKINKQLVLGLSFETSSKNWSLDFIGHQFYDSRRNTIGYFNYNNALKRISIRCEFKF